ncbi:hypothetical protein JG676_08405, partial [Campylobacter sp. 2018MI35]|uniref:hypothetical protein n=1 Tax=Campylobacter sp. 2018MI34 TaxID=2800582 RepID=UPI0019033B52
GNADMSSSASITTYALTNMATGSIDLYGSDTGEGRLTAGSLSNAGLITVHAGGALDITGDLGLEGDSSLTGEDGGAFTTGAITTVLKGGDGTISIIDMQGQSFESQYRIVVESGTLRFIGTAGTATPELTGAGIIQGE